VNIRQRTEQKFNKAERKKQKSEKKALKEI